MMTLKFSRMIKKGVYDLGVMRYNKNCDAKSDTLGYLFCILFICKNSVACHQECAFSKYKLINL